MAEQAVSEVPKYRITETCYHNDRIYDPALQPPDAETGDPKPLFMEFTGHPAHYMEPANAAAKAMYAKFPPAAYFDPINRMTALPTDKVQTL